MPATIPPLAPLATLRFDVVHRTITALAPRTVLEIGCGLGGFGARLATVARYEGVEPDVASCAVARERIEPLNGSVINGDHRAVPAGALYDMVCAFEVLEHLERDEAALRDWITLVRPGGHLVLSVPAGPERFGEWDVKVGHFRRYSAEDMRKLLVNVGFEQPHITLYGWPLGYALEFARDKIAGRQAKRTSQQTVAERTASSGRQLQPTTRLTAWTIRAGTMPFRYVQRIQPQRGIALVAVATRPR